MTLPTRGFLGSRMALSGAALGLLTALPGCGGVADALGMSKNAPDEFAVVTKAPLIIPPDYSLRPPQPGAPPARETSPTERARQALVPGAADGTETQGQAALLSRVGPAEDDIRAKVEGENREIEEKSEALTSDILFWQDNKPPANVIDATEEAGRLRAEGTRAPGPVPEGEAATASTAGPAPAPTAPVEAVPASTATPSAKEESGGWFDWF
ncbi:MAG: DUF3035 domain-containing protein [Alphaproteobacteria bacterium]|nr:DUF3035 domain-containing protein [Alphaproteobacteria bacterium]